MTPHLALLVNDRPALSRDLGAITRGWRVSWCADRAEASALITRADIDILVVDLHFGGDGSELLEDALQRCPGALRVLRTRARDEVELLSIAPVAHRMLPKPAERHHLARALADMAELVAQVPAPLRRRLGGQHGIPPLPWTRLQLIDQLFRSEPDLQHIGWLAAQDVGLAARFLQIVNSEYFGLARTITEVPEAVSYLGLRSVRGIVVAAGAFDTLVPGALREIQQHSLRVGRFAQELAAPAHRGTAATAGLLHDIGRIGIAGLLGDGVLPCDAPADLDHAQVGAWMLGAWGLPAEVVRAVGGHHLAQVAARTLDAGQAVAVAELALACAEDDVEAPLELQRDPRWPNWLDRAHELVRALPVEHSGPRTVSLR